MFTAQIGTTATFTASEWWIDVVGADLGILVTEVGMVYVPDVEDTWIDNVTAAARRRYVTQYQNTAARAPTCRQAAFWASTRKTEQTVPSERLLGRLWSCFRCEYNNAFDTGLSVAPTLVYSYDFDGTTPAPYGNYLEDRQSIGLGVTGTLNNNFRVGVNYSNFFGGHIATRQGSDSGSPVTSRSASTGRGYIVLKGRAGHNRNQDLELGGGNSSDEDEDVTDGSAVAVLPIGAAARGRSHRRIRSPAWQGPDADGIGARGHA